MPKTTSQTRESNPEEGRVFEPPLEFSQQAWIQEYEKLYQQAQEKPEEFWGQLAEKELHWFKKWSKVLDWDNPPFAKWFVGGKLNVAYNTLDRHLTTWRKNKAALIWEGEPGDSRTLTYTQLHREVCQFANAIKQIGVKKGDLVVIYMPMIPEAVIAMLACARIGAPHSVVFSGFAPEALKSRLIDAKLVITADGGFRKGGVIQLKANVDLALEDGDTTIEKVLVVQRTKEEVNMVAERDFWWHDLQKQVSADCPPEEMDSEDPLFILYTSGSTGKPKGVVHTTGGYNLYTHITTKWIFDLKDTDVFWCTADLGWITGHSYLVYGPLSNGATTVMYESVPHPSNKDCLWRIIEKYGVNIFYTAPTVIRGAIRDGENLPQKYKLSSLRLLGSVGEPINPTVWTWYHKVIGGERCPILDTWWQTETGGIVIAPLPGATPTKPGSCTRPFPGIIADIVDINGNPVETDEGGYLVIKHPWPGMLRTVYGDDQRLRETYWEHIEPKDGQYIYFAGDAAKRDSDGYFWVMGRVDDVINVSGHRLGTTEIESALVSHPAVAEAAVVGKHDDLTGEAIVAFVILEKDYMGSEEIEDDLEDELKQHVAKKISAIARPTEILFTYSLPKTFSGKILRRLLGSLAAGEEITGDLSTLEDINFIKKKTVPGNGRPHAKNLHSGGEINQDPLTLKDKLREIISQIPTQDREDLPKLREKEDQLQ